MGLLNAGSSGLVSSLVGYDFMGLYTTASTAVALGFQPVFPETAAQSGRFRWFRLVSGDGNRVVKHCITQNQTEPSEGGTPFRGAQAAQVGIQPPVFAPRRHLPVPLLSVNHHDGLRSH